MKTEPDALGPGVDANKSSNPQVLRFSNRYIGQRVHVFDSLESTNSYAARLASDPANDGVVVLAAEQTAGRGKYGRVWQAPAGSSVLMSVLIFPPLLLQRPALLTAWAAVSVCEVILELTGLQAKIKWPNDVLIHGKKVCGILIEQRAVASCQLPVASEKDVGHDLPGTGNWQLATVVGIGLNVNQSAADFENAGLLHATSVTLCSAQSWPAREIAQRLIRRLDNEYQSLLKGDWATLEACWKWRIGLLGRRVMAECHQGTYHGRLRELSFDGLELELDSASGGVDPRRNQTCGSPMVKLSPEAVQHLDASD